MADPTWPERGANAAAEVACQHGTSFTAMRAASRDYVAGGRWQVAGTRGRGSIFGDWLVRSRSPACVLSDWLEAGPTHHPAATSCPGAWIHCLRSGWLLRACEVALTGVPDLAPAPAPARAPASLHPCCPSPPSSRLSSFCPRAMRYSIENLGLGTLFRLVSQPLPPALSSAIFALGGCGQQAFSNPANNSEPRALSSFFLLLTASYPSTTAHPRPRPRLRLLVTLNFPSRRGACHSIWPTSSACSSSHDLFLFPFASSHFNYNPPGHHPLCHPESNKQQRHRHHQQHQRKCHRQTGRFVWRGTQEKERKNQGLNWQGGRKRRAFPSHHQPRNLGPRYSTASTQTRDRFVPSTTVLPPHHHICSPLLEFVVWTSGRSCVDITSFYSCPALPRPLLLFAYPSSSFWLLRASHRRAADTSTNPSRLTALSHAPLGGPATIPSRASTRLVELLEHGHAATPGKSCADRLGKESFSTA